MTVIGRDTPLEASQSLGARVLGVPPPLYYGLAFATGMLLHATTIPLALGARPETLMAAVLLLMSGEALALAGIVGVARHQTRVAVLLLAREASDDLRAPGERQLWFSLT